MPRVYLKLKKKNPPPLFLHTCETAKAVQELSEGLYRKITQNVSVVKLFAFVEMANIPLF